MALSREKTKKGKFVFEIGNTSQKDTSKGETIEEYFNRTTSPNKKAEQALKMFYEYHMNRGLSKRELRLDRTVVFFGRRKS